VNARDRRASMVLVAVAAISWLAVAWVLLNVDPRARPASELLAIGTIGGAVGLTATPVFWLIGFAREGRIAYRGDWVRSARRGGWAGLLAAAFVLLRLEGLFQPQIAAFLVAMATLAEVTLSARR
jgi:hypothetical protein